MKRAQDRIVASRDTRGRASGTVWTCRSASEVSQHNAQRGRVQMKEMVRFLVLAARGLVSMAPGSAAAATADGTLITNVACATFSANPAGTAGYAVSYCATATVLIRNPCIALQKIANPTVQASGGDVTFT